MEIAESRKKELLEELQQLLQIESILDESQATTQQPFGPGPATALQWMLDKGVQQGMRIKNVDYMAGHIEMGQGEELVGILCHVDVVPPGDITNWKYPPFQGIVEDGKLYGRGAIDDKGPTIAAWLAMKMVHDAQVPLTKRVRLIVGTDEESDFRCVERYFQQEEMPTMGFAPDADFPLINAEKGIAELLFQQKTICDKTEQLISFSAGERSNMVPDVAQAIVQNVSYAFSDKFQEYLQKNQYEGSLLNEGSRYIIKVSGKSAHAMEPDKGINAAILLATFLQQQLSTPASYQFVQFITTVFGTDYEGSAISLQYADFSGPTTLSAGIVTFNQQQGGEIIASMRYSVTYPFDEKIANAHMKLAATPFTLDVQSNSKPHYVSAEHELVQTLEAVYRTYTGDTETPLLSTGGGTYARVMDNCVAFGMLFPGEAEVAHQANEFVVIDHLVKAAAIYAEAIVQLAAEK